MTMRAHRIAELSAEIHEIDREIEAHRLRHEDSPAWRARANALSAQKTHLLTERTHHQALRDTEAT
jgi:hypothetical protein